MGMFKALTRIRQVNEFTLLGGGGEYSDLQYILKMIEQLRINDFATADGAVLTPAEIHSYLGRVMYNRRSKVDPLWNQLITAGFYQGTAVPRHDGHVWIDLHCGSARDRDTACILAIPLLRKRHRPDMSYEEARTLLEDCMKVLVLPRLPHAQLVPAGDDRGEGCDHLGTIFGRNAVGAQASGRTVLSGLSNRRQHVVFTLALSLTRVTRSRTSRFTISSALQYVITCPTSDTQETAFSDFRVVACTDFSAPHDRSTTRCPRSKTAYPCIVQHIQSSLCYVP